MKKIVITISILLYLCSCSNYNTQDSPINKQPHAEFSYKVQHPLKVVFTNLSYDYDGANSVFWDFGDGKTSTEKSPVHKYDKKGVYKVTLRTSSFTSGKSDTYTTNVTITEPTKCYVTGIVYEKVPQNNEYYNIRFTDDYIMLETLYWYTDWVLLSSANIPYTYMIKNKKQIDFSKSEYVMRLYQNGSTSGTGTQKASWSVYSENIKSKFAEQTTGTASNAKVTLLLEWKD